MVIFSLFRFEKPIMTYAELLIRKGKRGAAAYVQVQCLTSSPANFA